MWFLKACFFILDLLSNYKLFDGCLLSVNNGYKSVGQYGDINIKEAEPFLI